MTTNSWSSYRKLITGGSGSRKTNTLLDLIKQYDDDDDEYSINDPYEAKFQYRGNNVEAMILKVWKIQRVLLNIQIISRMFIKILKNVTQAEKVMY